jgi:diacylglycerol O-acyltransferase / wax synthase
MNGDRLSPLDVAFLSLERPRAPMHLGAVAVFRPHGRVNPIRLLDLLAQRAAGVPRLRQRVARSWFPPGGAVWVDDPRFEPANHIHRHWAAGGQVDRCLAEAMAQPLDLDRPLWELHLVTGLTEGRFAVLAKLHHALADGLRAVELGLSLLDEGATGAACSVGSVSSVSSVSSVGSGADDSAGHSGLPFPFGAALGAARTAGSLLARPDRLVGPILAAAGQVPGLARQCGHGLDIAASVLRNVAAPAAGSPWAAAAAGRRLARVRIDLQDVHTVRRRHGGTVHDVLLAVLAGALRQWLEGRGHRPDEVQLRVLIPVSTRRRSAGQTAGNCLSGYLCRLPVAEPDPMTRLRLVRAEMDRHKSGPPDRGAGALPVLANQLPAAVHRLAGPVAGMAAPLLFDALVTSVPLPNVSLHLAGAELAEVYPVVPLAHGHALGVGFTTYRGWAHVTLHADVDALPDLTQLAGTVPAELARLVALPHAS